MVIELEIHSKEGVNKGYGMEAAAPLCTSLSFQRTRSLINVQSYHFNKIENAVEVRSPLFRVAH